MTRAQVRPLLVLLAVLGGFEAFTTGSSAQDDAPTPGALVVVGGGGTPPEVLIEGLARTGAAKPHVVVLPQASSREDRGVGSAEMFRELGVETVDLIDPLDDTAAARIARADLIWFPGGDQELLSQALHTAKVVQVIHERHRAGAVVGGTSAGAAIMSRVMISGPPEPRALTGGAMRPFRGLGLWKGVIVDQHFVERDRLARLLTAVLDNPRLVGVGISERTACIVDGEQFEVRGEGQVLVWDARGSEIERFKDEELQGARDLRLHVIRPGERFDLAPATER
jgi:cyanophycinase